MKATAAPSAPSIFTTPSPIPRVPPVTSATLPSSLAPRLTSERCQTLFGGVKSRPRALDLEHVVAPAPEEHVPVVVEHPEVARRVEAVGREHVATDAAADPPHQVAATDLQFADNARRRPARRCPGPRLGPRRRRTVGRNCLPSPRGDRGRAGRRSTARTTPSYRAAPLAVPGAAGVGRTDCRLAGRRAERSVDAKAGCAARASAWSGHPRNSVTRSRSSRASVRAGSGWASITSVAPATRTERSPVPKPPTQKSGIGT